MKQNALLREMTHRIKRAEDKGIQIGMYTALKLVENILTTVEGIGEKRAIAIEEAIKKRLGELMEEIRGEAE
jgi:ERCC4-type nuclease